MLFVEGEIVLTSEKDMFSYAEQVSSFFSVFNVCLRFGSHVLVTIGRQHGMFKSWLLHRGGLIIQTVCQ